MYDDEFDKEFMNKLADSIETYMNIVSRYVILLGESKEEYDKAVKKVEKLIKHLRKGKGEKVFDPERYEYIKSRIITEEMSWDV